MEGRSKKQHLEDLNYNSTNEEIIDRMNFLIKFINEINVDYYPHPIPKELDNE